MQRFHYGWIIVIISILVVVASLGLGRFAYGLILPDMRVSLELTHTQSGLLATGNHAGYLAFALAAGYLASRSGPRIIIAFSLLLVGGSMFLTGLVQSFSAALFMRTLTGIGSGGSNVPVMGLLSSWFLSRRRGLAAGIVVSGSGIGMVITGYLVPSLMNTGVGEGWRYSWFYLGIIAMLLGAAAYLFLRNNPAEKDLHPVGTKDFHLPAGEKGVQTVLDWKAIYTNRSLWFLALIYSLYGFSYIIFATFFPQHTVLSLTGQGFSDTEAALYAGRFWSCLGFLSIFSGLIWGTLSDRVGRGKGIAIVYIIQTSSFISAVAFTSTAGFYLAAALYGISAWSIPGIVAAAAGDYAGPRLAPAALGMLTVAFGVGQAVGPSAAGIVADMTGTFVPAFLVSALAALTGAAGALLLKPPPAAEALPSSLRKP